MAEVYLATIADRDGAERHLALKMVHENHGEDPAFVGALINEARLAVLLSHDNIVQILDVGSIEHRYFVAMEFVDGVDVNELLDWSDDAGTRIPVETTAFIIHQVCHALHYAHSRCDRYGKPLTIVHRDVSPQNIMIGFSGDVKLTDFGIAKANIARIQTAAHVVKGKYDYMSPEHAWGESLDARADIFSLGVVMYQMLTGRIPLEDSSDSGGPMKRLHDLRTKPIPPARSFVKEVPERLDRIVMTALYRDREARFQTADDMRSALEAFLHAATPGSAPDDWRDALAVTLRRAFPHRSDPDPADPDATRVYSETMIRALSEMPRDTASLIFDVATGEDALTDVFDEPPTTIMETPTTLMDRPPGAPAMAVDDMETRPWTAPPPQLSRPPEPISARAAVERLPVTPTRHLWWVAIAAVIAVAVGLAVALAIAIA